MIVCTLAAVHAKGWCWHSPAAQAAPYHWRIHHTVTILHTASFYLLTVAQQDWHAIHPQILKIIKKKKSPETFREASLEEANAVKMPRRCKHLTGTHPSSSHCGPAHSGTSCLQHPCAFSCAQRSRDELFPSHTAHPDTVSGRLSSCLYHQVLETLWSFLARQCPFNDFGLHLLHTPQITGTTCHIQHMSTYKHQIQICQEHLIWLPTHREQGRGQSGEVYSEKCQPSQATTFSSGRDEHGWEGQDEGVREIWLPVSCLLATLFSWPTSL